MTSTVRWEFTSSTGWRSYDEEINLKLENAYQQGENEIKFSVKSRGGQYYRLVFSEKRQYNKDTGTERDVRRICLPEQAVRLSTVFIVD